MSVRTNRLLAVVLCCGVLACDRSRTVPLRPAEDAGRPDAPLPALLLRGIDPWRGPYTGETLVSVEGVGFVDGSTVVDVDGIEVEPSRVSFAGTGRLVVRMPPHAPGTVDVSVRVGGREAALPDAYTFDALSFAPSAAPAGGGQRVSILGAETDFREGDAFEFDGAPCSELLVVSSTEARCRVPAHGVGRVDVVQRRGAEALAAAAQAFEYVDTDFVTGGVSGESIAGSLGVEVVGPVGPVENALVRVVDEPGGVLEGRTDGMGRVVFDSPALRGPVSVHVGHGCYSRTSLVGVDARSLVVPLQLHRFGGDCPTQGIGGGILRPGPPGGIARGTVVFLEGQEFPSPTRRWTGLPEPRADERYAAFVWSNRWALVLDDEGREVPGAAFVTPEDFDERRGGIPVELASSAGVTSLCAVAGLEPREYETPYGGSCVDQSGCSVGVCWDGVCSPLDRVARLQSFVAGCSRPVLVLPGERSEEVRIEMNEPLTRRLEIEVRPLPRLDIENALGPRSVASSIPESAGVFVPSFTPTVDSWRSWLYGRAPFTARLYGLPSEDFLRRNPLLGMRGTLSVGWGEASGMYIELDDRTRYEARPLGVPRLLAPGHLGSFEDRAVAFAIDGDAFAIDGDVTPNLVQVLISPDPYSAGTSSPRWFVYVRGDLRAVQLPALEGPELGLPPGLYKVEVTAEQRERFDFNSWTFASLAARPRRNSVNRVYARVPRGEP